MSVWTHINGSIRIDNISNKTRTSLATIDLALKKNIPTGSEGNIEYRISKIIDEDAQDVFQVSIFGDLRDYENYQEVKEWFYSICDKFNIRQAILQVQCGDIVRILKRNI